MLFLGAGGEHLMKHIPDQTQSRRLLISFGWESSLSVSLHVLRPCFQGVCFYNPLQRHHIHGNVSICKLGGVRFESQCMGRRKTKLILKKENG